MYSDLFGLLFRLCAETIFLFLKSMLMHLNEVFDSLLLYLLLTHLGFYSKTSITRTLIKDRNLFCTILRWVKFKFKVAADSASSEGSSSVVRWAPLLHIPVVKDTEEEQGKSFLVPTWGLCCHSLDSDTTQEFNTKHSASCGGVYV